MSKKTINIVSIILAVVMVFSFVASLIFMLV